MVGPRGIQEDEILKKTIVAQIEKHVGSITAVLVLANGTLPRITVGTYDALSALLAILPVTLSNNIAFVLTNVSNPLYQNSPGDTVPDILKNAPQFPLDNPIPLQKKYLQLKDVPDMKQWRTEMRKMVKTGEGMALEMLVDLFDWLDGLGKHQTTEAFSPFTTSRNIMPTILDSLVGWLRGSRRRSRRRCRKVSGKVNLTLVDSYR